MEECPDEYITEIDHIFSTISLPQWVVDQIGLSGDAWAVITEHGSIYVCDDITIAEPEWRKVILNIPHCSVKQRLFNWMQEWISHE